MRMPKTWTVVALSLVLTACPPAQTPEQGGDQATTSADGTTPDQSEDIGEVLATVGDIQIGSKEFQLAASRKAPTEGEDLSLDERKEVLDDLVVEKMLYLEARKKGIDRDPKVQKVMLNTLLRQDVYSNVRNSDFSQDELRAYFDAHRDDFVVPEKVQVKRILIKITDERDESAARALAEDLRAKVAADPISFKEIATENSEDPYRRRGGDLGFVSQRGKPGIDSAVVDKAFTMEVGQVSEAFKADDGFNIIYIANKRDKVERTFEQMKGSVLRKVKNERYKTLYDEYVEGIRSGYPVQVDEAKLDTVEIEQARRLSGGPRGMSLGGPRDLGARDQDQSKDDGAEHEGEQE